MKAIVWRGESNYRVEDAAHPRPGDHQVLVEIAVTAICGSDMHLADFKAQPPVIPGHEAAGTIVEVGADVSATDRQAPKLGDRVALNPVQSCGDCHACKHGLRHLCMKCRHLGTTETAGTWAEYVAVDAACVHRIPKGVSLESASLTEPAAVCLESFRRADLHAGDSVVIIGDGPFGFLHAQIARLLKAGIVVVAGHHDQRLKRINAACAVVTCNTHREDLSRTVLSHAGGYGVDIVIEASGSADAPNLGLSLLRPRGSFVLFSYVWHPEPLDMGLIHMKELNILGSCRSLDAFDLCLRWMAEDKLDTAILLDRCLPLEEFHRAAEQIRRDKASLFKAALLPVR
jgi:threonine dehydrogenase-like Zn-dependent dehydrogenase